MFRKEQFKNNSYQKIKDDHNGHTARNVKKETKMITQKDLQAINQSEIFDLKHLMVNLSGISICQNYKELSRAQ